MGPIAKFLRLPNSERRLIIDAAFAMALVRLALSTLPFRIVRRAVTKAARPRDPRALPARPSAERISWAVAASGSHLLGRGSCLAKALAAEVMLGRLGYPSQLKLGVAKTASGEFEAHAWLESEGKVLIGQFDFGSYMELVGPGANNL